MLPSSEWKSSPRGTVAPPSPPPRKGGWRRRDRPISVAAPREAHRPAPPPSPRPLRTGGRPKAPPAPTPPEPLADRRRKLLRSHRRGEPGRARGRSNRLLEASRFGVGRREVVEDVGPPAPRKGRAPLGAA